MIRKDTRKRKQNILSDKIADLLTVAPSADVEDDHVFGTKPKTVTREDLDSDADSAEEATLSSFRKQNASLLADLSKRYAGEVTSKKDLGLRSFEGDSDGDSIEVDSDDVAEESDKGDDKEAASGDEFEQEEISGDENVEEEEDDTGSEDEAGSRDDEDYSDIEGSQDGFNLSEMLDGGKPKNEEFKHFKERDVSEDVKKGKCVKNQLAMWESLLEMRINLQKCLVTANQMPLKETFLELKNEGGEGFNIAINKSKGSLTSLLTRLMELQSILFSKYPETKNLFNEDKSKDISLDDPMDEEILSDDASVCSDKPAKVEVPKAGKKRKLTDYSEELSQRHSTYSKYRNSVVQKWNDKTRVTGVQKNQPIPISTLSQIDFILGDRNKLLRRTQLRRTKYEIVGEKKPFDDENDDVEQNSEAPVDFDRRNADEEYCSEIFDDDDFYHQLLRELIEHKSTDVSDPIQLSRQWILLQQMRSKMKRKVDTRATKGRRIRYAVHSKLVNFMAPEVNLEWTDEMKNELYASLFGKQFEGNVDSINSNKNKKIVNGDFEVTDR